MKAFKKVAEAIQKSAAVIPITLVFLALLIISIVVMYEDYSTSLAGYQALPTRKVNEWIEYFVAAIPQLSQVALVYIFVDNTTKKWAIFGGVAAWLVDSAVDIYYKSYNMGWTVFGIAVLETTIIYTWGSEILFTLSAGMLLQLLPSFSRQVSSILAGITGGGTNGFIRLLNSLGVINSDKPDNGLSEFSSLSPKPGRPKGSGANRMRPFDGLDENI